MTKPIRSYPEETRKAVASRRVAAKTGGLGYLAAVDYVSHQARQAALQAAKAAEAAKQAAG
jgi:hypothetical protein